MSAATLTAPGRAATAHRGPTFPGVVVAEWTKLTSLRSTWWTAGVTVAVAGVLTSLSAQASSVDPGFDPLGSLTTGLALAQVGPLVLGVLAGTGEYRTGAFRSTFTAVPRRWPVTAAQVVATAAFALLTGILVAGASVVGLLPAAASRGLAVDLTGGGTPGVLLGVVLLVVGLALFGLAAGTLLRRTLPALVTALVVVLVLPVALMLASTPAMAPAGEYDPTEQTVVGTVTTLLPGMAGQLMTMPPDAAGMDGGPDLGAVGGGFVLAGWILLPLAAAVVRLRTRDVT